VDLFAVDEYAGGLHHAIPLYACDDPRFFQPYFQAAFLDHLAYQFVSGRVIDATAANNLDGFHVLDSRVPLAPEMPGRIKSTEDSTAVWRAPCAGSRAGKGSANLWRIVIGDASPYHRLESRRLRRVQRKFSLLRGGDGCSGGHEYAIIPTFSGFSS
jgi:hypothetical protein